MFGAAVLAAGVMLGAYDRIDYDSIYAPRVTGVPPFYALRRLTACEDGEIRHYGRACVTGVVQNVYVASRDNGLTWKTFFTEPGDPEAMVKDPVSGDWMTIYDPGFSGPHDLVWSKKGPGDVNAPRERLSIGSFTFHRQPVYFPVNRRWIVTGGHAASCPMLLISSDGAHTWHRVDVTNVVSTVGRLVGHDRTNRWDNRCCEPTIYEKKDGTLVMYARTAFDHPYVYRSTDGGETWSAPEEVPEFWMSNTMPTFHRLKDGRLLFLWNNCQPLPRRDPAEYGEFKPGKGPLVGGGELVFTNRDVLHAAISEDDGETWIGCREVLLNPIRNNADLREQGNFPPVENDKSVHQSQVLELEGGKVLVAAGQNPVARRLFLFDPKWLYEQERHEEFRRGLNGLSNHLFIRSLSGGARGWAGHCAWNRLPGAVMRRDPDTDPWTKRESLNLARIPDSRLVTDRQGVAWNFPTAKAGCVELECRLEGLEFHVALNDHWLAPSDELNFNDAPVLFRVDPANVPAKKWIVVSVGWTADEATLSVNGCVLDRRPIRLPKLGLSYLHLRATTSASDPEGTYFHGFHMRASSRELPGDSRGVWRAIAETGAGRATVKDAELALRTKIADTPDELYLAYWNSGDRAAYEDRVKSRMKRLEDLLLGECLERRQRFVPEIEKTVRALCSQRSWVWPAHDKSDGRQGNFRGTVFTTDLASSQLAALLGMTVRRLGDALDPTVVALVKRETERRVFANVRASFDEVRRGVFNYDWHYPARTNAWVMGRNNWNAVCHDNVLLASQCLLDDPTDRQQFLDMALKASREYKKGFSADGYCSEGMSYWNYGFGHYLMMGLTARMATEGKVDFFVDPFFRAVGAYATAYQLEENVPPAFSDGTGEPALEQMALAADVWTSLDSIQARRGLDLSRLRYDRNRLFPLLFAAERRAEIRSNPDACPMPANTSFPDAQVWLFRAGPRLSVAVKGGHNDEFHNHNDLGSYSIASHGRLVSGDPGGERYTARTFSDRRYESEVLNSFGHPVPVIGGMLQGTGRQFSAKVLKAECREDASEIVLELKGAYDVPALDSFTRTFRFDVAAASFTVTDRFRFSEPTALEEAYVTWDEPVQVGIDVRSGGRTVRGGRDLVNPGSPRRYRHSIAFCDKVREAEVVFTFAEKSTGETR